MYGKDRDEESGKDYSTFSAAHHQCFIEQIADTGIVAFFGKLPPKSPETGTLRLFHLTNPDEYYSAYGPDALYVATNVFHTNSVIKYIGGGGKAAGLPAVSLRVNQAQILLREALTTKQLRVEIWTAASGQGKKASKFELDKEVCHFRSKIP